MVRKFFSLHPFKMLQLTLMVDIIRDQWNILRQSIFAKIKFWLKSHLEYCDVQGSKQLLDVQGYVIQYEWFMIHIYPQIKADKNELTEINI